MQDQCPIYRILDQCWIYRMSRLGVQRTTTSRIKGSSCTTAPPESKDPVAPPPPESKDSVAPPPPPVPDFIKSLHHRHPTPWIYECICTSTASSARIYKVFCTSTTTSRIYYHYSSTTASTSGFITTPHPHLCRDVTTRKSQGTWHPLQGKHKQEPKKASPKPKPTSSHQSGPKQTQTNALGQVGKH